MTYREFFLEQINIARSLKKEESAVKILMLEICSFSTNDLYINYDNQIPEILQEKLKNLLYKYFYQNQPIQYILGYTYFYGLKLKVNSNVLIPRPETELLVEIVLSYIKNKNNLNVIDVGCGSGAIALALKKENPNLNITGVDISAKALDVARENSKINNLNIEFIESNLFEKVNKKYDILVSNPPYIAYDEEVEPIVYENEPHSALFSDNDGLFHYQEILKTSSQVLNIPSLLAFEIPYNKDLQLIELVEKYYKNIKYKIIKDLNNKSRILVIENYWR